MNWIIVSCVIACASLAAAETYTDRYDNINLDEIIANPKLLVPYVKCVLDEGKCTPEGKELKSHIKDGMQTACEKCTEQQRKGARKVVAHIKANQQEHWEAIKKKFDPEGKFKATYEAFLARDD